VVILENNLQLMDCESPLCRIHSFCKFKNILQQATRSFLNTLGQYTLADLLHQKTELAQALDLAD
jgi:Rrf2 family nitric oxide-sensitive transcriptional repressor